MLSAIGYSRARPTRSNVKLRAPKGEFEHPREHAKQNQGAGKGDSLDSERKANHVTGHYDG